MGIEAEVGVMHTQAKDCQESPGAERDKEGSLLKLLEGAQLC